MPIEWQATFGEPRALAYAAAIVPAPGGGYLLAGALMPSYYWSYWVIRADAQGARQWDRRYYGSVAQGWLGYGSKLHAVHPVTDGYLLGGESDELSRDQASFPVGDKTAPSRRLQDMWLIKTDANGSPQWDRTYGGSGDDAINAVVTAADGGYYLVGVSASGADGNKSAEGHGGNDGWVVKIDANGSKLWDQSYGGVADDSFATGVPTPEGGAVLLGYSSSGPGGTKTSPSFGRWDVWAVKIDKDGRQEWEESFGGSDDDEGRAVLAARDGGFLLAGWSQSPVSGNRTAPWLGLSDAWLIKVAAGGTKQWDHAYGGESADWAASVVAVPAGGCLLGCSSASPRGANKDAVSDGPSVGDYWIVRIDDAGNRIWDQSFGGSGNETLRAATLSEDRHFALVGQSSSKPSGNKTAPLSGERDLWVVQIPSSVLPRITQQPRSILAAAGMTVTFLVQVSIFSEPRDYEWRLNGEPVVGATNATLTIRNVGPADAGRYTVLISNVAGSVQSDPAILTYSDAPNLKLSVHPSLTVYGPVGSRYRVEYADDIGPRFQWNTLGELVRTNSPQVFFDTQAAVLGQRIYRVLLVP